MTIYQIYDNLVFNTRCEGERNLMKKETFFDYPVFDNIKDIIYHSVKKYPENVAFRLKEKYEEDVKYIDITYKEFLKEVNNLGTGLFSIRIKG